MTALDGWRPMRAADLEEVEAIADIVHTEVPERPEVFIERFNLFPQGCWMTEGGYAIVHPVIVTAPPPLDSLLGALPEVPEALHVHDVALLPGHRGRRLGEALMARVHRLAAVLRVRQLTLISIHGSHTYWRRYGFQQIPVSDATAAAVASYGEDAIHMARMLDFS